MATHLLDRNTETEEILKIINTDTEKNKIILLTGISGVGKSGLIEKMEQTALFAFPVLHVKVSKSSIDTIENLQYFNALYKRFVEFSKSKIFDKVLSPTQQGTKNIKNLFKVFKSIVKSKLGINEMISLAEPEENESVIRKKDYLLFILKKNNLVLDIENIQNIDTQSFELLKEIINVSTSKIFILEYTLVKDNDDHYKNFYNELKETNAEIWSYKVEKMDFMIAKELTPQDVPANEENLQAIYDKSEGNLMEIILSGEYPSDSLSNIDISLKKLSKNEKYILYILFLYDAPIYYDELANITVIQNVTSIVLNFEQLEEIINSLYDKKIVIIDKEFIKIKHDSISEKLNNIVQNPVLLSAYTILKSYYNNRLNQNPKIVEKLLTLYLKFSDQELLLLLPKVKLLILNIKYPQLIIKKLKYFREQLTENAHFGYSATYPLTLMLVEICIRKKIGEEAQKNLELIYDETNDYHVAMQAQIYSLQESMVAHDSLCKLVESIASNSRLRLIAEISLLYLKTKLQTTAESKAYGDKLIKNTSYKKYTEYAFLLRNYAELCDETKECEALYFHALKILKSNNMYHDMASIYISLSMINAYVGNVSIAKKYIKDSMKLDRRELSLCYILNNSAVLNILENAYTKTTEKNLRDALLLSESKYEMLIINCNLLIYYCLTHNHMKAEASAYLIESSDYLEFQYEELLHIIFQNLYYFYSVFDCGENKKNYYYSQILKLIETPNIREFTKVLASGMNNMIQSDNFYAHFPYRVDFLGYWEFTIDSDLGH